MKIILASSSPRRKELLSQIVKDFELTSGAKITLGNIELKFEVL